MFKITRPNEQIRYNEVGRQAANPQEGRTIEGLSPFGPDRREGTMIEEAFDAYVSAAARCLLSHDIDASQFFDSLSQVQGEFSLIARDVGELKLARRYELDQQKYQAAAAQERTRSQQSQVGVRTDS